MNKLKQMTKNALALSTMGLAAASQAAVDTAAITTEIDGVKPAIVAVFAAIIGVVAVIFAFKIIKGLIK